MSGANAPKLSDPLSITVKNLWQVNLRTSEQETCSQFGYVTVFVTGQSDYSLFGRVLKMPDKALALRFFAFHRGLHQEMTLD